MSFSIVRYAGLIGSLIAFVSCLDENMAAEDSTRNDPFKEIFDSTQQNRKVIIGHRGFSEKFPENSFIGFDSAMARGVDFIEFDIFYSKDGVPFIIHDEMLGRTTNVEEIYGKDLKVSDLNSCQLKNLSIDITLRGRTYPKEELKIPTFMEMLDRYGNKVGLFVNIKEWRKDGFIDIYKLVLSHNIAKSKIVIENRFSYNPDSDYLAWFLIYASQIDGYLKQQSLGLNVSFVGIENNSSILTQSEQFEKMGKKVIVWTVNDTASMRLYFKSEHVFGIVSDNVDDMIKIRNSVLGEK